MAGITQLGKTMMVFGCFLFIGLMSLWFGEIEQERLFPNKTPASQNENGVIAVTLKQDRQGHYTVSGLINNAPIDFLVDTGATDVVIPAGLAKQARQHGQWSGNGLPNQPCNAVDRRPAL
jgi:aspartyl protease family protein